jgi:hypothetical protein
VGQKKEVAGKGKATSRPQPEHGQTRPRQSGANALPEKSGKGRWEKPKKVGKNSVGNCFLPIDRL